MIFGMAAHRKTTNEAKKYPFLVGFNPKGVNRSTCTGTMITKEWFLTAAHCTDLFDQTRRETLNEECVKATKKGSFYKTLYERKNKMVELKLKCRFENQGNALGKGG